MKIPSIENARVAVIGLGYVGLPLAVAFGKRGATTGFDVNLARVAALAEGIDSTREVDPVDLLENPGLQITSNLADIADADVYIVTVPTPIDQHKRPDLTPLRKASESVGSVLTAGNVVIYESTVYPGATEEVCVPILEQNSGLKFNEDFAAGYSPERINPGDKVHTLADIVKVTSGSTPEIAEFVDGLYNTIIRAGTYRAESIKVAEAAKVIENTQRDLNIALVNELAMIFNRLGIDTQAVLNAAGTKWNFLKFTPGLVGGHCIGVDPYYLTHKAQEIGYLPQVILAGRRINDGMGEFVVEQVVKLMIRGGTQVVKARVLVLGLAFKEDCPDIRNTRVVDIVEASESYGFEVDVHDPNVDAAEAKAEYGIELVEKPEAGQYDAIILAVAHSQFRAMTSAEIRALGKTEHVFFDVKHTFPAAEVDGRL